MSSSPNLLEKDDDDDDPSAEVDEEDDDNKDPSAEVDEEKMMMRILLQWLMKMM